MTNGWVKEFSGTVSFLHAWRTVSFIWHRTIIIVKALQMAIVRE